MEFKFTIPELLRMSGLNKYSVQFATAMNKLINAGNEIEYTTALHEATTEIFYGDTYFPELPKFMPLTLLMEGQKKGSVDDDLILESAIVAISNTKNIVKTQIENRDATVKEYISRGDYNISIKGVFAFKGLDWPRESVSLFRQYMELKTSIKVTHDLLNQMGIHDIVVESFDIPENTFINLIPYTIQAVSDEPVEFIQNS